MNNVFCAAFAAYDANAASCTRAATYDPPDGMPFCGSTGKSLVPIYGAGSLLTLVMNAVTYAVSLRPNPARNRVTIDQFFPASLSAQFQAPLGAPPASPSGGV
jgi:hypothetical protein